MSVSATAARLSVAGAVAAATALAGAGVASAATVPPPSIADHTVTVQINDPLPNSVWPPVLGQTCSGALVPLHAVPGLVGPLLDGDPLDIIATLLGSDDVTVLHLPASPALIATVPGVAGTLVANDVREDFYLTAVICNGGGAPVEPHVFLTQVGNPVGAFVGSVSGSTEGLGSSFEPTGSEASSGSGEGSSIDAGSLLNALDGS